MNIWHSDFPMCECGCTPRRHFLTPDGSYWCGQCESCVDYVKRIDIKPLIRLAEENRLRESVPEDVLAKVKETAATIITDAAAIPKPVKPTGHYRHELSFSIPYEKIVWNNPARVVNGAAGVTEIDVIEWMAPYLPGSRFKIVSVSQVAGGTYQSIGSQPDYCRITLTASKSAVRAINNKLFGHPENFGYIRDIYLNGQLVFLDHLSEGFRGH